MCVACTHVLLSNLPVTVPRAPVAMHGFLSLNQARHGQLNPFSTSLDGGSL